MPTINILNNALSGQTGSGAFVGATSPVLTTPTLGVATAASINKVILTTPATGSTLTIADGKTLTVNNSLTVSGTDSSSVAFGIGGILLYTNAFTKVVQQIFTATGTYTPTSGMAWCIVELWGPGGGGGGAAFIAAQTSAGGSGAGGSYVRAIFSAAAIGASQAITLPSGGGGGNAAGTTAGVTQSPSTFGALLSAVGGKGCPVGYVASTTYAISSYAAVTTDASVGTFIVTGESGRPGFTIGAGITPISLSGGRTFPSTAGTAHGDFTGDTSGQVGTDLGAGGGGGVATTQNRAGGAGGKGRCVITEFIN
jgi:hypothetical protein